MLGLSGSSQTTSNLLRTKQCVLNLPSDDMIDEVNALARTTGCPGLMAATPEDGGLYFKRMNGYSYVSDKFSHARLTPLKSDKVRAARIAECPAQMEAELEGFYEMKKDMNQKDMSGKKRLMALEVKVLRTHVHGDIMMEGYPNRIDPDKWRPMIMSFQELYGLDRKLDDSILAQIPEESYRIMSNPAEVEKITEKQNETEMDTLEKAQEVEVISA